MTQPLPKPELAIRMFDNIPVLTDDALASSVGVRVAFTGRAGGLSKGPFASLNLGTHVDDERDTVLANRALLMDALGYKGKSLIVPNQVHGVDLVAIDSGDPLEVASIQERADLGADGLIVTVPDVAALLCFADCLSMIIVSPTGHFAVVHAGWRGALEGIVGKAVGALRELDERANAFGTTQAMSVYIGPYIHVECFETGDDIREKFADKFGDDCVSRQGVDLGRAVSVDAVRAGVDPMRIVVAPYCTRCCSEEYFSYRASEGVCGRHGAFAIRCC